MTNLKTILINLLLLNSLWLINCNETITETEYEYIDTLYVGNIESTARIGGGYSGYALYDNNGNFIIKFEYGCIFTDSLYIPPDIFFKGIILNYDMSELLEEVYGYVTPLDSTGSWGYLVIGEGEVVGTREYSSETRVILAGNFYE